MTPIHLTRFALALAVVAAAGVPAIPAAAAGSSTAPATVRDGRSPDTLDAAQAAAAAQSQTDGRSPDTLDAVYDAQFQITDGRSPDTLDAASAPQPVTFVQPGGFDWADAGIGAGIATALLALIAGSMLLWSHRRPRQRIQAT